MSFKNISHNSSVSHNSSPVFRQLAKQAIESGRMSISLDQFIPEKVAVPTQDLLLDVASLSAGLRAKGFVSESQDLQRAFALFKMATFEYSKTMLDAHPEGDVEMGEASGDLADVETKPSQDEKMQEVAKKAPTGKMAHDVLMRSVKNILKVAEEDEIDQYSGGLEKAQKTLSNNDIGDAIHKKSLEIYELLKTQNINPAMWVFTQKKLELSQELRSIYSDITGNPTAIDDFLQLRGKLFGAQEPDDVYASLYAGFYKFVKNFNYNELNQYAESFGLGKYFWGSQPSPDKQKYLQNHLESGASPALRDNEISVWKLDPTINPFTTVKGFNLSIVPGMFQTAIKELSNKYLSLKSQAFSSEALNKATVQLQEIVNNTLAPYNGVAEVFQKMDGKSFSITLLDKQIEILSSYNDKNLKSFLQKSAIILSAYGGSMPNIIEIASAAIKQISDMKLQFANFAQNMSGNSDPSKPISAASAKGTLLAIIKMYATAGKSLQKDDPSFALYDGNMRSAEQFYRWLTTYDGKPYSAFYSAIKHVLPDVKTYDQFLDWSQKRLSIAERQTKLSASNFIKSSQAFVNFIKLADEESMPSVGGTNAAKNSGGTVSNSAPISAEEKSAVKAMQLALFNLASLVQKSPGEFPTSKDNAEAILISVGRNGKTDMDGAWGPKTADACVKANLLISEWNSKHSGSQLGTLSTKPMMGQGSAAIQAAMANTAVLNKMTGGTDSAQEDNTELDAIRGTLILASDISSPQSFYKFLKSSGWSQTEEQQQVDTRGNIHTGITNKIILMYKEELLRRAKDLYTTTKTPLSVKYYSLMIKLSQALSDWQSVSQDRLISEKEMSAMSGSGTSSNSSNTSSQNDSAYNPSNQNGQGNQDFEGGDVQSPERPNPQKLPFDSHINLVSPYFRKYFTSFPEARNIGSLSYDTFENFQITNLFESTHIPQDYEAMLNQSAAQQGYYQSQGKWLNRNNQISDPEQDPAVKANVELASKVRVVSRARSFLRNLLGALQDVRGDWVRQNPKPNSKLIEKLEEWQQSWAQIINEKLQDIAQQ